MSEKDFVVTEMIGFFAVDPADNSEGLIGERTPNGWLPFVCADHQRVEIVRPRAIKIAREMNLKVLEKRFVLESSKEI